MTKKVIAISSSGGHWVQLRRLSEAFSDHDVTYISTDPSIGKVINDTYYSVRDSNMWDKFGLIITAFQTFKIIFKIRPDIIVTTGAAPGFFAIMFGKLINAKTIWIDSIANSKELSLAGRKAKFFADVYLTQWESLADEKINLLYKGQVL